MLVMLFALAGCENPAGSDGSPGQKGDPGNPGGAGGTGNAGVNKDNYLGGTSITAAVLEDAFKKYTQVILLGNVQEISGIVPEGKILSVTGTTKISSTGTLEVQGTLDIQVEALFSATGQSGTDGWLLIGGDNGKITTTETGRILLPYDLDKSLDPASTSYAGPSNARAPVISYTSAIVSGLSERERCVGSTVATGTVTSLTGDGLASIFALADSPATLAVENIADVKTASIPYNKKLIISGLGTLYAANATTSFETFNPAVTLVIVGSLATSVKTTGGAHIAAAHITIEEGGSLNLMAENDDFTPVPGEKIKNNGTITTVTTSGTNLGYIVQYGDGNIEASGNIASIPEKLKIPENVTLTLSGTGTGMLGNSGAYGLAVEGKLILDITGDVDLTSSGGDITITGSLQLNSGAAIKIQNGTIIDIKTNAVVSGDGVIIAEGTTTGGTISIGVDAGYMTTSTGVKGKDIEAAVEALKAENVLTDVNIPGLGGVSGFVPNATGSAIGTVLINSSNSTPIHFTSTGTGDRELKVKDPDTTIVLGGATSVASGDTITVTNIKLEVNSLKQVCLEDSDWTTGSSKKSLIKFESVRFENKGLIYRLTSPCHVGVNTDRT
jgi:hypothetical protein